MALHDFLAASLLGMLSAETARWKMPGRAPAQAGLANRAASVPKVPFARAACACPYSPRTDAVTMTMAECGVALHVPRAAVRLLPNVARASRESGGGTPASLQDALQLLADAAPAARARLMPFKTSMVSAWQQHSEAIADAQERTSNEAGRMTAPAETSSPTWAIATLDGMPVDDPLWPSKIALLQASLALGCPLPSASAAGDPPPGPRRSGKWCASLPAIEALPLPFGGAARALRGRLADQLRRGATAAIIESLFEANAMLSPAERPMACWIPCLLGLEAWRRVGCDDPCAAPIQEFIAANARLQLSRQPSGAAATWLVGAERHERCAAVLLAVLFMRRGVSCRPWTADGMPTSGCYLLAGIGAADPPGELPANCLGTVDLLAEAQRNDGLALAASQLSSQAAGSPRATSAGRLASNPEAVGLAQTPTTSMREDAMPKSIIRKFQKEYGKQHGKEVYYATANKEGRDPETFHKGKKAPTTKRRSGK
jgi:hypothetical protein